MNVLLINNKQILLDGKTYIARPELEEFKEYEVVDTKTNYYGHYVYLLDGIYGWLLAMRFVWMETNVIVTQNINDVFVN